MHSPADGPLDPIEQILLLDPFFGGGGGEEPTVQHFLSPLILFFSALWL